ncbi:sugar transporter ERD6-like 7 isoform X3 [Actinidia eriantha]|uniref:sugar transporter ERD6-like 7 isoform X3 n=1 Tax=Actinidia eriantha TaxID=165200 RepID=UPI0025825FDC|nr:sugar transporter ERD6-like 7 isoform X3 [Actinidia eriantha]
MNGCPVFIAEITPTSLRGMLSSANLAMVGKKKEFEEALQKLRGPEADISQEKAIIQEYLETLQGLPNVSLLNMFEKSNIHPVAVGLMAFQQFMGVNRIIFYATNVFKSAALIDKAGRRPLLLIHFPNYPFLLREGGRERVFLISHTVLISCVFMSLGFYISVFFLGSISHMCWFLWSHCSVCRKADA